MTRLVFGMNQSLDGYVANPCAADVLQHLPVSRRNVYGHPLRPVCFHGRKINFNHVFAGQNVSVMQVGERIWLVPS
jgi:hypothetical protein